MSEFSGRQFVDTNVLVYAHDISASEKHIIARDLVRDLWQSGSGCLSIQVLQEFYVTVTQKVARPMLQEEASGVIADVAVWQVHRPGLEDVLDAIQLQRRYLISFWDAMIVNSAIRMDCQQLWSEDLNPGQVYGTITVLNPFV